MAGHSHAKNVMHQKGASDSKKAKIFNKLAREIMVSAKTGAADSGANPRLRAAISAARKNNMPRERIERAIKLGQPGAAGAANYEEVRYEGYGPGGCALIIEALTDNRHRTASELRTALSKLGGALGESGSVVFMFSRIGEILYPAAAASADAMLEAVIEAGGEDVESVPERHEISTSVDDFGAVRDALQKKFGDPESAKLAWRPQMTVPVSGEDARDLAKLLEVLEDNDDVQDIIGNFDIPETEWDPKVA
jgi:YebC/PmpR family DNA-binding regulatory protein